MQLKGLTGRRPGAKVAEATAEAPDFDFPPEMIAAAVVAYRARDSRVMSDAEIVESIITAAVLASQS